MRTTFDVIIIGAGMVGLSLAKALAMHDFQVALIDAGSPVEAKTETSDYEMRVSAITRASQQLFSDLEVWPAIVNQRVSAYQSMHVWDAGGTGKIHFDSAEISEPNLGYIIENRVIQHALTDSFKEYDNFQGFYGCKPVELEKSTDAIHVELNNQQSISGKLLVGADGAHSWLRQACHMSIKQRSYGHSAIVATVNTEFPHQYTAWQRFLPTGPLAFLPLAEQRLSSIVWSTTPDNAEQLMALDDASFGEILTRQFDTKLGNVNLLSKRVSFPLVMRHAKRYIDDRIALIGDAAHTVHPLAGQGVNLGLLDVAALAEVVIKARDKQRDFSALYTLRRYERWRKGENQQMIWLMDMFKTLFAQQGSVPTTLRNLGLNLVDQAYPIKHRLMQRAMGL